MKTSRAVTMGSFLLLLPVLVCPSLAAEAKTRGLKMIPVKDAEGNQVAVYKNSYALIVGVSKYNGGWPKLTSVPEETKNIAEALSDCGFAVRLIKDPNSKELRNSFQSFIEDYGYDPGNRLLVYFSGHGYSRKASTKGYLVPVDAPNPVLDDTGFLRKALPMSQLLAWSRQIEARHVLFMFDSCFSGTIFKSKGLPKMPPHISKSISSPVRQFIAAGDADEAIPAKSVFSLCFLRALRGEADYTKDGYVTGTELGMYLCDKMRYYESQQTPQYGKIRDPELDQGDFVFIVNPEAGDTKSKASAETKKQVSFPNTRIRRTDIAPPPVTLAPATPEPVFREETVPAEATPKRRRPRVH